MIKNFWINVKTFFRMFKQLMCILDKGHRIKCIFLLVGIFICAFLETLGVSAIIPFILVLFSPDEMMENKYIVLLSDTLHITSYQQLLIATAMLIILAYVVKNLTLIIFNYFQSRFRNEIERDLTIRQYKTFMLRPYAYYLNTNTAEVIRGLGNDIVQVAQVMDCFTTLISEILTVLMIGAFIVVMDPLIALGLIGTAGLIALIFVYAFKRRMGDYGAKTRDIFFRKSKIAIESASGFKEISVYQKKKYFTDEYSRISEEACRYNTGYLVIMSVPNRVIETVFISCLLLLACLRVGNGDDNGQFVALIGAMAVASVRVLPSISNIAGKLNGLIYNRIGLESAYYNIQQVKEAESKMAEADAGETGAADACDFEENIRLENIWFRYDNTDRDILKGIDLTIKKNESVAFIGESGAGKSTLVDVLLGLLIPQRGQITLDGKNISDMPYEWAKLVGYVPQSVYLMDDSLRRNIAFGVADEDIDEEKVWLCLREASLEEYVRSLPEGLDTNVGERGVRFSGGQRQRVAIARALYHDPQILVLDEATSALDNNTESEVMEAIDNLQGKMTIIIVAHRLSTVEKCDYVYKVEDGQIERDCTKGKKI